MKLKLLACTSLVFSQIVLGATAYNGYIVKFKSVQSFLESSEIQNLTNVHKVAQTSFGNFAKVTPKIGFTDANIEDLKKNPNVEYVEPNYLISIKKNAFVPADTFFVKQWGLKNEGSSSSKANEDINAEKAWEITKGSRSIKIAVIDSGVDYNHADLKNQIDINMAEKNGKPGIDDDRNGYIDDIYGWDFNGKKSDPMDGNGHGTHCAGVIGAQHDGKGVAGVMANVKIIPIKFLDDKGVGEDLDAVLAIDYALKRGANILSNSWGSDEKVLAIKDAIKAAKDAGVTFVVAAGNENSDNDSTPSYPSDFDLSNIITVGAFTNRGYRASFSNFGAKKVHVFAPGEDIYSTVNGNEYEWLSGTSMATPFVSGIVGLMLSKEPSLTPLEIRNRLIRTSVDNGLLNSDSISNGRVDAYKALMNK